MEMLTEQHRSKATGRMLVLFAISTTLVGSSVAWTSISTGGAASFPVANHPPNGLTTRGQLLWNLEALLQQTFGDREVSVSGRANFSCSGLCAPLAKYSLYRYTFVRPRGSSFRISSRPLRRANFGNALVPVLVRGRPISCDNSDRRYVVRYVNAVSFTLGCEVPLR